MTVPRLAHPHRDHRPAPWPLRLTAEPLPGWLDPLYEAHEMRAVDAWAIEDAGRAVAGPDGARGHGPGARHGARRPARARSGSWSARATTAATAWWRRGSCARRAARSTCWPWPPSTSCAGDAAANLERLPGAPPEPFDPEALAGSGAVVDALLGTGFSGEPREPVAGAIAAINDQDAPVVACDVPSGVDASTGEVAGEAVRAAVHRHLPRLEGRPARGARRAPRGRGGGGRDRRAPRRARRRRRPG